MKNLDTPQIILNMFRRLRRAWLYQNHLAQVYISLLNYVSHVAPEVSNVHQFPSFRPSYLTLKTDAFFTGKSLL